MPVKPRRNHLFYCASLIHLWSIFIKPLSFTAGCFLALQKASLNPAREVVASLTTVNGFMPITWAGAWPGICCLPQRWEPLLSGCWSHLQPTVQHRYMNLPHLADTSPHGKSFTCPSPCLSHTIGDLLCYCLSILYSMCFKSVWGYQKSEGRHDKR